MQNDPLKSMIDQAVDLKPAKQEAPATEEDALRSLQAQEAMLARVAAWDKAMNRAFKGIISRPLRHKMMMQGER